MTDIPFEATANLLQGKGRGTVAVAALPGEIVLDSTVANFMNLIGGALLLSNVRLVFAPLDVADVTKVFTWGISFLGGPDIAAKLVTDVVDSASRPQVLGNLSGARAGTNASVMHPPTLIATGPHGAEFTFGVLYSQLTPSISSRNNDERDRFVNSINSATRG
ncbi:hypothetical protein HII28_09460 [Planctomonas sp. JC2975]|uniref:hypothetical protein n=1 Tax=Planctomonas sp. JC2975 TaxID=2729626 RepID=UPI001473F547|nr:hypothetical protein [Planctomonas sp. JC2975]NNC12105.1 hypothetical protein [Planctomonas sp. JC2975]